MVGHQRKLHLHRAGVEAALAQIVSIESTAIRFLKNISKTIVTTVLEQYEKG